MLSSLDMSLANIIFAFSGIILMLLGTMIWKKRLLELLAGYDENKVTDKIGLAKYAGSHLILMGVLIFATSILGAVLNKSTSIIFFIIVVTISIKMVIGFKRFEKR